MDSIFCGRNNTTILRRWASIVAIILGLFYAAQGRSLAAENPGNAKPADLFKRFVENPPTVANLIYEQEVPEQNGKESYFFNLIRWQTNAVMFGESYANLNLSGNSANLGMYSDLLVRYNNKYSRKQGVNLYEWVDTGKETEKRNSIQEAHDLMYNTFVADMLNMGCNWLPVNSIHWMGDKFDGTNENDAVFVHGELSRDAQGRAEKMTVEVQPMKGLGAKSDTWTYEYRYDAPLSLPYLPNRILSSLTQDGSKVLVSSFKIYQLQTSPSPLPEGVFTIPREIETNNLTAHVTISNKFLVYDQGGHHFKIADSVAANQARTLTAKVYFILALLLFSPLIFFWVYQQKAKKVKQ